MMAKFLVESLFLVIITVLFQWFLMAAIDSAHKVEHAYEALQASGLSASQQ